MSNLSFAMYTTQIGPKIKTAIQQKEVPASPYHWPKLFRGDVCTVSPHFDPEQYDVVYIDAYTLNLSLVADVREKIGYGSSTKIVADVDWGQDHWWKQYAYPNTFKREINCADVVFHVSHYYCKNLERFLKRKVYYNPHPMDLKIYDFHRTTIEERKRAMVILGHHYEAGKFYLPFFATWDLPITVAFNNHMNSEGSNCTALYDIVTDPMPFSKWIDHIAKAYMAMETYQLPCASRAVYEAAALGVPVVGSKYVEDLAYCFPDLTCEPNDMTEMHDKLMKLIKERKFYDDVMETAIERSKFYGYKESKERFLRMLDDNEDR